MKRFPDWKTICIAILCGFFLLTHGTAASVLLTPGDMMEDLEFLETTLRQVHPEPFRGSSVDAFVRSFGEVRRSVSESLELEQFYYHGLGLTAQLADVHTRLYLEDESKELPVRFWWAEDGLTIAGATAQTGIPRGSIVQVLGTLTPDDLLEWAADQLPAENQGGLAYAVADNLHSGGLLEQLGLATDQSLEITAKTPSGDVITSTVNLRVPVTVSALKPERPNFGWYIVDEEDIAVLYMDFVDGMEEYKQELARFFRAVMVHGIEDIVLDLRWNAASNVDTIAEFLRYFPEQRIEGYAGEIRYSQQAASQRGYEETLGVERVSHLTRLFGGYAMNLPPRPADIDPFGGRLYVLTSPMTAGTAHWFAVVIRDNDLGLVTGQPTGQRPSGYGDPLQFTLPNSKLRLTVSHKRFIRPDPDRDPADELQADWPLPITAAHVAAHEDLQLGELLERIRSERGTQ